MLNSRASSTDSTRLIFSLKSDLLLQQATFLSYPKVNWDRRPSKKKKKPNKSTPNKTKTYKKHTQNPNKQAYTHTKPTHIATNTHQNQTTANLKMQK